MPKFMDKTGEITKAANGQAMKIIKYRSSTDVDIQFEDGTIVQHKTYNNFIKGQVLNPNYNKQVNRMGETKLNRLGKRMTIIAYRGASDIDVQFDSGYIKEHCSYNYFKKGKIEDKSENKHIGVHKMMNCGIGATVIEHISGEIYKIRFDDGLVKDKIDIRNFYKGSVKHPDYNVKTLKSTENARTHIGEHRVTKYGETVEIIDAKSMTKMLVRFLEADKTVWTDYKSFTSDSMNSKKHRITKDTYTLKQYCKDKNIEKYYQKLLGYRKITNILDYDELVESYKNFCNKYNINMDQVFKFRREHPELTDEQVIIHFRPDCYINIFGELIGPIHD